ncbi:hypothetical protein ADL28_26795 [Streptomyces violaceusniger]|uniref:Uncharacterized protein n=2 Tax=Streptomyces TaxID=1883 RepID=A0A0X3VZR3_STRVO|nr:hypothetical protein AS97_31415 [Streptomyces sp. AgN23]KUL49792.1 hypothetical protein ADL28_26795 [Streptomyces violaceusniger]RSS42157.1 hypothetical protein EF902_21230 [Streptomyces sp. WAC05858]
MRGVTHHITATREDGTVFEVSYGYGPGQRRLLGCKHCDWQERITSGGARHKGLDHLAQAHGALGSPRMTADAAARRQVLLIMLACFAAAAVIVWWAAAQG